GSAHEAAGPGRQGHPGRRDRLRHRPGERGDLLCGHVPDPATARDGARPGRRRDHPRAAGRTAVPDDDRAAGPGCGCPVAARGCRDQHRAGPAAPAAAAEPVHHRGLVPGRGRILPDDGRKPDHRVRPQWGRPEPVGRVRRAGHLRGRRARGGRRALASEGRLSSLGGRMPAEGPEPPSPASGISKTMDDDGAAQGEQTPSPGHEHTSISRPSPAQSFTSWWRRCLHRLQQQPRLLDGLLILLVAVSTVVSLGAIRPGWEYAVFGLISAAALWWRRTHPLLMLTITIALSVACTYVTGTPGEASLAAACALYAVLTVRAPRPAWLGLLVATAVVTAAMLLWGDPAALVAPTLGDLTVLGRVEYLLVTMITTVALWCVALMIGSSVRAKRLGLYPPVEEDLRKRGPIRRFLRKHPWTTDLLVVLVFLGLNLISTTT